MNSAQDCYSLPTKYQLTATLMVRATRMETTTEATMRRVKARRVLFCTVLLQRSMIQQQKRLWQQSRSLAWLMSSGLRVRLLERICFQQVLKYLIIQTYPFTKIELQFFGQMSTWLQAFSSSSVLIALSFWSEESRLTSLVLEMRRERLSWYLRKNWRQSWLSGEKGLERSTASLEEQTPNMYLGMIQPTFSIISIFSKSRYESSTNRQNSPRISTNSTLWPIASHASPHFDRVIRLLTVLTIPLDLFLLCVLIWLGSCSWGSEQEGSKRKMLLKQVISLCSQFLIRMMSQGLMLLKLSMIELREPATLLRMKLIATTEISPKNRKMVRTTTDQTYRFLWLLAMVLIISWCASQKSLEAQGRMRMEYLNFSWDICRVVLESSMVMISQKTRSELQIQLILNPLWKYH